jgi:hypothetical protein
MAHFIARVPYMLDPESHDYVDGVFYAYNRRATGRLHERETHFGPDLDQARVFNTRGAATSALKPFYPLDKIEVLPVKLTVQDILDLAKGKAP